MQTPLAAEFTSPRRGEVGLRSNPGEGSCSLDRPYPLTRFATQIDLSQGRGELSTPLQLDLISSRDSEKQHARALPRARREFQLMRWTSVLRRRHIREYRLDLGLQRGGVERLDDVVVHAGLLGR